MRQFELLLSGTAIPLPCFFPSVSSVKTNLMPVDYVELLDAAAHPLFLVSAYDIANSCEDHQKRINDALQRTKVRGSAILMDSGNYEGFWKGCQHWDVGRFHAVCQSYEQHLCFCYDNQNPPDTAAGISEDVVASVLRDQERAIGTVIPILHGPTNLLPIAVQKVAENLYPVLLAVPERALGEGLVARTQSIRKIRKALNDLDFYCPLHLLGTGNPLSILAYAIAGADSFDGLEWCQTVVDHNTGLLYHFQQWDFFRNQTSWGTNGILPYIQSTLMHNLTFYEKFMRDLRYALLNGTYNLLLRTYLPDERANIVMRAISEDN